MNEQRLRQIQAMADKLPVFDPRWDAQTQEHWQQAYDRIINEYKRATPQTLMQVIIGLNLTVKVECVGQITQEDLQLFIEVLRLIEHTLPSKEAASS